MRENNRKVMMGKRDNRQLIPKTDEVLKDANIIAYRGQVPDVRILRAVRESIKNLREQILSNSYFSDKREDAYNSVVESAVDMLEKFLSGRLRKVINATGVVAHTNIGRSPISKKALKNMEEVLGGYSNLEYDVIEGKRRNRLFYLEQVICDLSGAEAALVVNNNAAAVFLALNTLCNEKEAVLSRGEIVEIGDSFRVSEIISSSGAFIREVGTTNRVYTRDYECAITPHTGMILKVHTSNFKVIGFTEEVYVPELSKISEKYGIPLLEDMGSGVLTDTSLFGLPKERHASDAIREGADIITFSGDKMLGGPQAGIIAGKKVYIDKIKRNQLLRCMRIDKVRIALLEAVLSEYYCSREPDLPVFSYLLSNTEEKAKQLLSILEQSSRKEYDFRIVECASQFGGGSMPGENIKSLAIAVTSVKYSANEIERMLRHSQVPIIATVQKDETLLNLMTIDISDFSYIQEAFRGQP